MVNGKLHKSLFLVIIILLSSCSRYANYPIGHKIHVVSVSTNGDYAVSNAGTKLILWDIKNHTSQTISNNANIYSAYFIKNTNMFMWQDLNDIVHIQNIYGKGILSFHNFPTYGQVITSDLKHYFACNENLDLYEGYGKNQHLVLTNGNQGGFEGAEKLLNLTLSKDNQFLLTSGNDVDYKSFEFKNNDGVTLWNVNTGHPIRKYPGNIYKTIATISPDNKYIVSGDENSWTIISYTLNGDSILKLFDDSYGKIVCGASSCYTDTSGYPPIPKILYNSYASPTGHGDGILNLKFIDLNNHYLHFTAGSNYAVLYQVTNAKPIKYLPLGNYPWIITQTDDYFRDQAIDTAPAANILVMAQADSPRIIVYKFDPKTLTLKKIWAPGADFRHFIRVGVLWFLIGLLCCILGNIKKYPTTEKVTSGITIAMMLLAMFFLNTYGFGVGLLAIIISMIINHFLNFPEISLKKLKLIHH